MSAAKTSLPNARFVVSRRIRRILSPKLRSPDAIGDDLPMGTKAALIYDFDGTLAPGNMQGHGLLAELGHDLEPDFWAHGAAIAREQDADEVLVYMWRILQDAKAKGIAVTKELLGSFGAKVPLFPGVETWFARINRFALEHGLELHHYVVSSGLFEMIRGCRIDREFTHVFASKYMYDDKGEATAPGVAINYTTKTQYLFRINKGIMNSFDRKSLNGYTPEDARPVPFERMIFLGDGDTDIPTMKMITYKGGEAIGVFGDWREAASRQLIHRLIEEDRVKRVAPADYREDSQLDVMVKGLLGRIARASGWKPDPKKLDDKPDRRRTFDLSLIGQRVPETKIASKALNSATPKPAPAQKAKRTRKSKLKAKAP